MRYIEKILLGLDQFGNTILGGAPDETISARSGRLAGRSGLRSKLFWTPLARVLNSIQPGHTEKAIVSEETGKQQDSAYAEVYDPDDIVICVKDSDCD
jgi:hypothetical protein